MNARFIFFLLFAFCAALRGKEHCVYLFEFTFHPGAFVREKHNSAMLSAVFPCRRKRSARAPRSCLADEGIVSSLRSDPTNPNALVAQRLLRFFPRLRSREDLPGGISVPGPSDESPQSDLFLAARSARETRNATKIWLRIMRDRSKLSRVSYYLLTRPLPVLYSRYKRA